MLPFLKLFPLRRVTLSALASLVLTVGALTGSALAQADAPAPEASALNVESGSFASGSE